VNGVGKGTYDSLHIKSKISLIAEKPYYKRGKLEGDYTVEEFIKLPKEKRTICLEPEPNPIEFKNIDEKTKRPISGVKNIIKRKRGNEVKTDTLISNRDGNFVIGDVVAGEDISIVAQYPPDYEDNDRTIKNKTGEEVIKLNPNERIIPLKPKEVELVFRTIDEDDGSLIPSANLQIYFDGQIQNDQPQKSPNNSGNGEFVIKVPVTAKISIIASKQGYGTNTTKINNALVKTLIGKPQPDRDIPLKTPKLGCNQPIEASKGFSGEMYFQLGKKSYDFKIDYKMHGHPDKITIYCGRGKGGKILWEDTITDMEGSPKTISYDATQCDGITIEIIPTQNNQGSSWEFSITCPE
jgi:hypothetical protein